MLTQLIQLKEELVSDLYCIKSTGKSDQEIQSINLIIHCLTGMKDIICHNSFRSQREEILFFKKIKPEVFHKLILLKKILQIESEMPVDGRKSQIKLLRNKLKRTSRFYKENKEFCSYMRQDANHFDNVYFTRNNQFINSFESLEYFDFDPLFSTVHSIKASHLLACDKLREYLKGKIEEIKHKQKVSSSAVHKTLKWTDSKTDLVELIYALHSKGSFNNGQAEIKEIAHYFSKVFSIEIGDFYRNFLEIKNRQNPTKLLEQLQEKLNNKIEEQDLI